MLDEWLIHAVASYESKTESTCIFCKQAHCVWALTALQCKPKQSFFQFRLPLNKHSVAMHIHELNCIQCNASIVSIYSPYAVMWKSAMVIAS